MFILKRVMKMDFLEIMDICAYDIDDAKEMANRCCSTDVVEEVLSEIGLEKGRNRKVSVSIQGFV